LVLILEHLIILENLSLFYYYFGKFDNSDFVSGVLNIIKILS